MRLNLANDPAIALAQEWVGQLDDWFEQHGTAGFDPFDVKAHPLIQKCQSRPLPRRASTVLCDLFPRASRRLLGVQPSENPKTHALLALGLLRLHQATGEPRWLEKAVVRLRWLMDHPSPGQDALCWGYPFSVTAKGLHTPPHTPVAVVSAIAGQAFLLAWEVTESQKWVDAALSVARFMMEKLPRLDTGGGLYCFAYTPGDHRRVFNASLLTAEHLIRCGKISGKPELVEAALPAVRCAVAAQREDGAWPYGMSVPGDGYEPELLAVVDHHHTGFVLRSLHAIDQEVLGEIPAWTLEHGFDYYRKHLLEPSGMPRTAHGRMPVDIHACAEAVLCPSVLSERFRNCQPAALAAMRWAHEMMRDPRTGAPWHRKYPLFTSKIAYPRWGAAWMHRALAEYLFRFHPRTGPGSTP